MNYLVVDDEPLARKRLIKLLRKNKTTQNIYEASNGKQALEKIKENIHIVFLDIRMPVMDGIETARHINKLTKAPVIIFTTAYDKFALDAFENNAIAYLMKPIESEKLNKAIEQSRTLNIVQLEAIAQNKQRTHIFSKIGSKVKLIPLNEVLYFLAEDKYIAVIHKKGKILIDDTIKHLEKEYADQFIRAHRNALVKKDQVKELTNKENKYWLGLKDSKDLVEVSRRSISSIREYMSHC